MQAYAGPRKHWTVGEYAFGMYTWKSWECTARGLGSHGKTPWTAWNNQRKWAKRYATMTPEERGIS